MQKVLNSGAYYNRSSGSCPYGESDTTKSCDFSSTGLTDDAKNMIASTKWYLGGWNFFNLPTDQYYGHERGTTVSSGRPKSWMGEVGLVYPSDYGYAASGNSCLSTSLNNYNVSCMNTDWLFNSSNQWTITPNGTYAYRVFILQSTGSLYRADFVSVTNTNIRPSVYLKSNVSISSGNGSSENPYKLKMN